MKTSPRTLAFTNFRTPRWIAVGVLAALAILLTPGISSAANGTWTSTAGGVTTTNNWSDTLKWLPGSVADGAGSLASFSSTITNATYITLDSSRTLGTLYFGVSGVNYWNLNTNSAGAVLTLDNGGVGAQPGISNASSGVVSIYTSLAGTQGLLKSGAGDVRLYSTNTFSGQVNVAQGLMRLYHAGALGATGAGNDTVVSGGAILYIALPTTGTINEDLTLSSTAVNAFGVYSGTSAATWGGKITLAGLTNNMFNDSVNTFTITGKITGSNGWTKSGTGLITLSTSTNDYTGLTVIKTGTLYTYNYGSLGAAGAGNGTVVSNGSTLMVASGTSATNAEDLFLTGLGNGGLGALYGGASAVLNGTIAVTNGTSIQSAVGAELTLLGKVTGSGGIAHNARAGMLTLGGSNDFTGAMTVTAGSLKITDANALGAIGVGNETVVSNGAAVYVSGGQIFAAETLYFEGLGTNSTGGALRNLSGDNTLTGAITIGSLTGGTNTTIGVDAGSLTLQGQVSGSSGFTKVGVQKLILGGSNDFSGVATVLAGALQITDANALGAFSAGNGTVVSNGAALYLSGGAGTTFAAEAVSLTGFGTNSSGGALRNVAGVNVLPGAITITNGTAIGVDAGSLELSGGVTGSGGFTKLGAQTLILSGASNRFSALASVSNGTLRLAGGTNTFLLGVNLVGGSLLADSGAFVTNSGGAIYVGLNNTNSSLTLDGGNTRFTSDQPLYVGRSVATLTTNNTLTVTNGAQMTLSGTAGLYLGFANSTVAANGNRALVTGSNSTVNVGSYLYVGTLGGTAGAEAQNNSLVIDNGGAVAVGANFMVGNNSVALTTSSNNTVTVGSNATLTVAGTLGVGQNAGGNTITINPFGTVSATNNNTTIYAGAGNLLAINGGRFNESKQLVIQGGGAGVSLRAGGSLLASGVTVSNGGFFEVTNGFSTVAGTITNWGAMRAVNGGATYSNAVVLNSGGSYLSIGETSAFKGGLTINSGGSFQVTNGASTLSGVITNSGAISVVNGGATWSNISLNGMVLNSGSTLNLHGGTNTFLGGVNWVGGSLLADAGSLVAYNYTVTSLNVGSSAGSSSFTLDGSRYVGVNGLNVGRSITAQANNNALTITNGAAFLCTNNAAGYLIIGNATGGFSANGNRALVTGSNSTVNTGNSTLHVGDLNNSTAGAEAQNNALVIDNGGAVTTYALNVGLNRTAGALTTSSNNTVTVGTNATLTLTGNWGGVNAMNVGQYAGGNTVTINAGGTVNATGGGTVIYAGTGNLLDVNGGTFNGKALTIQGGGAKATLRAGGTLAATNLAILSGGTLEVIDSASSLNVNGWVINSGTALLSNAYTVAAANPWRSAGGNNQFTRGLQIASGGRFEVTNGASTVSGVITNSGTISVVNGSVTYLNDVVNRGAYVSDPSTNTYVGNLFVDKSGSLSGSNGDLFVFQQDFINQSTNRAGFNLRYAQVLFTNSATHLYSVSNSASVDVGSGFASLDPLTTNFAIGTLSIAQGNRLTLSGNKDSVTNAVYVGWLDIQGLGSGSLLTNNFGDVTNTLVTALYLPNINLYYDIYNHQNDWITANMPGTGYDLWGGGLLLPIPEPSTTLALGAGLALLAFLRRKTA